MSVNVYGTYKDRWGRKGLEVIPEVNDGMVCEEDPGKERRNRRRDTFCDDGFSSHLLPKCMSNQITPSQTEEDFSVYERCEAQVHFEQVFNRLNGFGFGHFLHNHQLEERHRAKMLDWMLEVLAVYKQSQATFYRSVLLLDLYYGKKQKRMALNELHLSGIACMLIASKQEEVNHLKMDTILDNIGKNKFSKEQLLNRELDILLTVQFNTNFPTFNELFKCSFRFISFGTTEADKFFQKSCFLLSRVCLLSYHILSNFSYSDIALSCIIISLKLSKRLYAVDSADDLLHSVFDMFKVKSRRLAVQRAQICHEFILNLDTAMPFIKNIESFCDFNQRVN